MPTAKRTERLARAELWGDLDELARRALEEDGACDDVTTRALIDSALHQGQEHRRILG